MNDAAWLADFVKNRSPAAFEAIVARYGPLVYAAARRHVADAHLAEDIAQAAFVVLAEKAGSVAPERSLAAWLLTTTRWIAMNQRRKRSRLLRHEQTGLDEAANAGAKMNGPGGEPSVADEELAALRPLLDEGLDRLSTQDRDVLVWRFFESFPLAEIGRRSGVSEEAARKRVARALERLRTFFRRRGVKVEGLAGPLAALAVAPPLPQALHRMLAVSHTLPPAAPAAVLAKGTLTLMAANSIKLVVGAGLLALLAGGAAVTFVSLRSASTRTSQPPADTPAASREAVPSAVVEGNPKFPSVAFDDGTHAELTAVRSPVTPGTWWAGDGSPVPDSLAPTDPPFLSALSAFETETSRAVEFRVHVDTFELQSRTFRIAVGAGRQLGASLSKSDDTSNLTLSAIMSLPREQTEEELFVSMAAGPWTEIDTLTPAQSAARAIQAAPFVSTLKDFTPAATQPVRTTPFRISSITGDGKTTRVECANPRFWDGEFNKFQSDWQIVVVTRRGRTVTYRKAEFPDGRITYVYNVPLAEVVSAKCQTRPFEWKSLGNIRLTPATQPAAH